MEIALCRHQWVRKGSQAWNKHIPSMTVSLTLCLSGLSEAFLGLREGIIASENMRLRKRNIYIKFNISLGGSTYTYWN